MTLHLVVNNDPQEKQTPKELLQTPSPGPPADSTPDADTFDPVLWDESAR